MSNKKKQKQQAAGKTAPLPEKDILKEAAEMAAETAEQAMPVPAETEKAAAEETAADMPAEAEAAETAEAAAEAAADEEPAAEEPAAEGDAAQTGEAEDVYTFKMLVRDVREWLTKYSLPDMLLPRCIAAYFLTAGFWIVLFRKQSSTNPVLDWQSFIGRLCEGGRLMVSVIIIAAIMIGMTCLNYLLPKKAKITDATIGIAAVLFFDTAMLWRAYNAYMTASVTFISLVFIYYLLSKLPSMELYEKVPAKVCGAVALVVTLGMTWFIASLTVKRHLVFGTASHDFGLFVQMFYNLAERLSAITTCEREYPISHFRIHASYIYYLWVPFYKLAPKESTLLILQAIFAMGGAVPTYLIAKKHNFKGIPLLFITLAYTFSVCFVGPCFYEVHENAFLPTLLMWLLWAVDSEKHVLSGIFAVMVCITKEDAPLYVLCIGLYMFFDRKGEKIMKRIEGLIYAVISGGYMLFITKWLTENGDGQMMTSTRFGNMMINHDGGLTEVIKNVLLDPSYFFSLLIKEETLRFFISVMLPMLFLPFVTKKIHRFWLMVPFIVMNLAIGAGYGYAADVNFHYVFGTGALLIFMVIRNTEDLGDGRRQYAAILAGSAAVIFFVGLLSQQLNNRDSYSGSKEYFDAEHEMLNDLPKDKVVGAIAFMLPHCANRDYVYLIDNNDFENETDRFLDPQKYDLLVFGPNGDIAQRAVPQLEAMGWTVYDEVPGRLVIYQNPASPVAKPDVYAAKAE